MPKTFTHYSGKREVFYVYSDTDPDDVYKEGIDYENLILLKDRKIQHCNMLESKATKCFDFKEYTLAIIKMAFQSNKDMNNARSRTLPYPINFEAES